MKRAAIISGFALFLGLMAQTAMAQAPADDVEELVMVTGASHVLGFTSHCTSMFLRMNPLPTGEVEVISAELSEGYAVLSLVADVPFDSGQSEMNVALYEDDEAAGLECSGTVRLPEGSRDLVWGALHRHTQGVGALMWDVDLGDPGNVLFTRHCLENFPVAYAVTDWSVRMVRSDVPDEINFFVDGRRNGWGDGCLELE